VSVLESRLKIETKCPISRNGKMVIVRIDHWMLILAENEHLSIIYHTIMKLVML
jgi:hypothetical protein